METYNLIADVSELKWFFDHVLIKPKINESYSAVFVSRHKKLTKDEQQTIGMSRRETEFLSTVTFKNYTWDFDTFLKTLKRFNVDKYAFTTSAGEPLPEKTLVIIFYVNPCDDMKVCKRFVDEYNETNECISKAMLNGNEATDKYRWFNKCESTIKHLRANSKGSRYYLDYDIDVPKWFKTYCYDQLKQIFSNAFGCGNYIIIDTSGGYHVLIKTTAITKNPHDVCKLVDKLYRESLFIYSENPYDKYECIINDSQIPGIPLPGTYQYGKLVTILNKEDL